LRLDALTLAEIDSQGAASEGIEDWRSMGYVGNGQSIQTGLGLYQGLSVDALNLVDSLTLPLVRAI